MVRDWRRRKPREVHTRAETVPQDVLDRLAALERRSLEWETAMQFVLQVIEDHRSRVGGIESALDRVADIAQSQLQKTA